MGGGAVVGEHFDRGGKGHAAAGRVLGEGNEGAVGVGADSRKAGANLDGDWARRRRREVGTGRGEGAAVFVAEVGQHPCLQAVEGEAKRVVGRVGRHSPEDLVGVANGNVCGHRDFGMQAVVAVGAGTERLKDRHAEGGEGEQAGLAGAGHHVVDAAGHRVDAGLAGVDPDLDDSDLGVDRAGLGGELSRGALRQVGGQADQPLRSVDGDEAGVLAIAGRVEPFLDLLRLAVTQHEGDLQVGMGTRPSRGGQEPEALDRDLGRCGRGERR